MNYYKPDRDYDLYKTYPVHAKLLMRFAYELYGNIEGTDPDNDELKKLNDMAIDFIEYLEWYWEGEGSHL